MILVLLASHQLMQETVKTLHSLAHAPFFSFLHSLNYQREHVADLEVMDIHKCTLNN